MGVAMVRRPHGRRFDRLRLYDTSKTISRGASVIYTLDMTEDLQRRSRMGYCSHGKRTTSNA
jgi:hypothetical protein